MSAVNPLSDAMDIGYKIPCVRAVGKHHGAPNRALNETRSQRRRRNQQPEQ